MNRITRREILRRLAGISVLGAVGVTVRATVSRGGHPEAHSIAAPSGVATTQSHASPTATSLLGDTSTSMDHAHHAVDTTFIDTTSTEATGTSTETTSPSTSSPSTTAATPTAEASTTSSAPQVAVGTSKLSGVLGPTTIAAGAVATIVGDVELRGDLVIEGVLSGIDTFTVRGNGYQIEVRNGGQLDLRGIPKSGWVRGVAPSGWRAGDRVLTAPVDPGCYGLSDFHTGSPGIVNLADGRTIAAEQFNLTRSITIDNVSRIMFHMGAGRQVLKHIAVTNSGVSGKLAFYPIHFHLNGNTSRGSIVEGVVVENGRFHAFVPHASHGITFLDCVAYNIVGEAYWWDPPPAKGDTSNNTHDTIWQHCLAALVSSPDDSNSHRLAGYVLGDGSNNHCVDCTAVAVQGGQNSSGFTWPEARSAVWEFRGCVAHNNKSDGIFTWQNNSNIHRVDGFIAYRCGRAGIENGAYSNNFQYVTASLTDTGQGVISHALTRNGGGSPLIFENVIANNDLLISKHKAPSGSAVVFKSCRFPRVVVSEVGEDGGEPGIHEMVDTGLQPINIDVSAIHPASIIRISEQGSLRWEWAGGSWKQV
jgi:hypothetical protein